MFKFKDYNNNKTISMLFLIFYFFCTMEVQGAVVGRLFHDTHVCFCKYNLIITIYSSPMANIFLKCINPYKNNMFLATGIDHGASSNS